jgi:hypothetical protein
VFDGHHAWVQAKTDTDDPDLHRHGGGYRQLQQRAVGSVSALIIVVVVLAVLRATG